MLVGTGRTESGGPGTFKTPVGFYCNGS
jgi:hypothetical protein